MSGITARFVRLHRTIIRTVGLFPPSNIFVRFRLLRHFTRELQTTDTQSLLAEYVRTGSESAFRELVARYLGLVYSTALRLVGGDTHLAEDVAQTVFIDLARKARGLSSRVMLGGWLHQRTYNVAAPMMRAQRRRQSREREAVLMNALQSDPPADLAQVEPLLDEAITQLAVPERTAIILRFFEQRDFRSIGQALGSSEDAARMRVTRALDKLHVILKHRGVTLSAAALGTALATETLAAAPAGLAAGIAGTALANAAAAGVELGIPSQTNDYDQTTSCDHRRHCRCRSNDLFRDSTPGPIETAR